MSRSLAPALDSIAVAPRARTTYWVPPIDVSKVICHRQKDGIPEFLVRWRTKNDPLVPPRAAASWHDLGQLSACLHLVQSYVESLEEAATRRQPGSLQRAACASGLKKRKAPGADPGLARDVQSTSTASGLPTPLPSHLSRSPSVSSQVSSQASTGSSEQSWMDVTIYNGILQKKEGWYSVKKPKDFKNPKIGTENVHTINASKLPTQEMLDHAAITPGPLNAAEAPIRNRFLEKVSAVSDLHLENKVDRTTPSLNFDFIEKYVFRNGIVPADEFYEGCLSPCRPNMGGHCGCELTHKCGCLEFAGVDEDKLKQKDPAAYQEYKRQLDSGEVPDTRGLPKRFPYKRANNNVPSTLQKLYRDNRHAIYECNHNCNCGPTCKSRLVQKGRQVGLTIFKTDNNRGWGVYCNEDLEKGEFIEIYLGEVITNKEADRRESEDSKDKASYLYSLDKFVGDQEGLTAETCHVVDGQYMGGPTRFINHSCEPNCRQYTVSYNKHDLWIYDLAFFAYTEIPAGTELTFDYMDKDEEEEEEVVRQREEAANDPENMDKKPCNCGAAKCRGYLWV